MEEVLTTYTGSFPLPHSRDNVRRVLRDVAGIGIDWPNYPQLINFIDMFLAPLARSGGLEVVGGRFVLTGELRMPNVDEAVQPIMESLEEWRELSGGGRGLRACVTGPFTLSSFTFKRPGTTNIMDSALGDREAVHFMARYVNAVLRRLEELGVNYVNVDEPIIGTMVGARRNLFNYSDDEVVQVVDEAYAGVGVRLRGIHVCGRLNPKVFGILGRLERVNLLDNEYADSPENVGYLSLDLIGDKRLAVGVVSSRRAEVEDAGSITRLAGKIMDKVGRERVFALKPDCGFGSLRTETGSVEDAYEVSLAKLRALKVAANAINGM
ncbi:hypothetical protein [Thermocladium modestius]|uniref:hypothetical protein n=1 Tax=Thermocladium modestius TaxID=62609 RepID=UPI001668BA63|nr:hypothetical protein [Thermocladium modestius]